MAELRLKERTCYQCLDDNRGGCGRASVVEGERAIFDARLYSGYLGMSESLDGLLQVLDKCFARHLDC